MIRRVKGQLKNLIRRSDSVNENVEVENSPSKLVNIQMSFFFLIDQTKQMIVFRIGPSTIMDHLFEVFLCDAFRKRAWRIRELSDSILDKIRQFPHPFSDQVSKPHSPLAGLV